MKPFWQRFKNNTLSAEEKEIISKNINSLNNNKVFWGEEQSLPIAEKIETLNKELKNHHYPELYSKLETTLDQITQNNAKLPLYLDAVSLAFQLELADTDQYKPKIALAFRKYADKLCEEKRYYESLFYYKKSQENRLDCPTNIFSSLITDIDKNVVQPLAFNKYLDQFELIENNLEKIAKWNCGSFQMQLGNAINYFNVTDHKTVDKLFKLDLQYNYKLIRLLKTSSTAAKSIKYLEFCSKYGLFLNNFILNNEFPSAYEDSLWTNKYDHKQGYFNEVNDYFFQHLFNQIKEDYITARYTLFQGMGNCLGHSDEINEFFGDHDIIIGNLSNPYGIHIEGRFNEFFGRYFSPNIGLVKNAFAECHSILDKIALAIFFNAFSECDSILDKIVDSIYGKNSPYKTALKQELKQQESGHFERLSPKKKDKYINIFKEIRFDNLSDNTTALGKYIKKKIKTNLYFYNIKAVTQDEVLLNRLKNIRNYLEHQFFPYHKYTAIHRNGVFPAEKRKFQFFGEAIILFQTVKFLLVNLCAGIEYEKKNHLKKS